MPRSTLAVELNTFVAGLITEATPLTFPANASLDEDNFVLDRKGSRQRRLGMDLEDGAVYINTGLMTPTTNTFPITTHRWRNAGGSPDRDLLVVQMSNKVQIFNLNSQPVSAGLLFTHTFSAEVSGNRFSYAVVDGLLVFATGGQDIHIFEYVPPSTFTITTRRLMVRDQFGIEAVLSDGTNLREGTGVAIRPREQNLRHIYNLRNQSWAEPRKIEIEEVLVDPIKDFRSKASNKFPSNSDSVNYALYADTNDADDRLTERFISKDLVSNPVGTFPAPRGYFIIDAIDRGTSRVSEYQKLRARNPQLGFPIDSLPLDSSNGGATVITEYAGRVWYAGFPGEIVDGDAHSPRMASYVLFSQLVDDTSDITSCYQDGDPTSKEDPDLLDTDGGFIRIDGAYGIVGLVNVGSAIMVVASNGVWMIQGGSDYGFKATNYLVTKITNRGCEGAGTLVVVDNTFMYWSDDGIYSVAPSQFGDYQATNLTRNTIQSLYDRVTTTQRSSATGVYDTYSQKVRWVFNNRLDGDGEVRELILDLTLGAFSTHSIKNLSESRLPLVIGGFTMPPFMVGIIEDAVTVNGEQVTVSADDVFVNAEVLQPNLTEVVYLTIVSTSPTIRYSFSYYKDTNFKDWESIDGVGVDANAFLLTGWMSANDYQRYKQVPYITFHFNKTENGFEEDEVGDWAPLNPSSCMVSAPWDWANHANSGQWGRKFQAYRFKRHYIPSDISDTFNNGYRTVVTKNKLRGKGKVVSLLIETEPEKDCQLLGWSMVITSNGNV